MARKLMFGQKPNSSRVTNTNLSANNLLYWHLLTRSKILRIIFKRHTIHIISTNKGYHKNTYNADYQINKISFRHFNFET